MSYVLDPSSDVARASRRARVAAMDPAEKARVARVQERRGFRPKVRYSKTQASGHVEVVHGEYVVAVLDLDALFGWQVSQFGEPVEWMSGGTFTETLDLVCRSYVAAWQAGEVA